MTIFPPLVALVSSCVCMSLQAGVLSVSTWAGEHADVIGQEIFLPYTAQSGIPVSLHAEEGVSKGFSEIEGILELSLQDAIDQCDSNQLMLLPTDSFGEGRAPREVIQDFLPNTLQPCAVGHSVWATVVSYNGRQLVGEDKPHLIGDFFNTAYYPGKRVLRKSPEVLAEWALVASGIQPQDVYKALYDTDAAWSLIEKKLNAIKPYIIWVDRDIDAIELLQTGQATFAMLGNDSLINTATDQGDGLSVLWDSAVAEVAMWAIPTNAPNPAISWDFLKFASSVAHSGKIASAFGYSPVRYSTLELVDKRFHHLLPTAPENSQNLLWGNSKWWRENSTAIISKFAKWFIAIEVETALTLASAIEEIPIESQLALGATLQMPDLIAP